VGPDFKQPAPPAVKSYTREPLPQATAHADVSGGQAQRFAPGADIPAQWWTLFHCTPLNALIEEAMKANPDIGSAQAALRVAMENVRAQQAAFFPTLQGNYAASRNQNSTTLAPTLANSMLLFNLYQGQLTANWTPDIWGGNRRQVESLQAQADAQRFQLESAYLTLTANLVAGAVQEASLHAQIAATEEIVAGEKESLAILQKQLSLGQVAGADVAAQEAALAQAEQALPPQQKQLAQERDLLTALAGRLPAEEVLQTFQLEALQLPQDLPLSIPSKLVEQRPDIRMAEENLHSASAEVGVAIANMLPNITLSGNAGSEAIAMGALFTPGNQFWSVGSSVTQTLFDAGALLHKTRAARAALDQAGFQYRSTVVTAFQNVADTLHALNSDAELFAAASRSERAASDSLHIARRQLELGAVSYLALLNAQQTYQQAAISRIQAQAARLADTAALFQALGGGWWNRPEAHTEVAATPAAD
jgi:NodT family efflux transporter outer membrane factor (OMF) lipoprotein